MTVDNIIEEINKAKTIVILTHENPDGDAVGSSLALYNALKLYGKDPEIIIPEYPKTYDFLPGSENIKKEGSYSKYDLAIALDCATIKMLNGYAHYFEDATMKIVIDHHQSNTMYGDFNYINSDSPACCQNLLIILNYLNIEITKDIGTCILTGIITDTGGFKYQGVTPETFEFVASLLNKGVNVSNIYRKVLQTITRPSYELRKIATNRLEFLESGTVTYTYITLEDAKNVNAQVGDYEGIVDIGKAVEDVEVSIFVKETEANLYRVSFRANDYVNVSDIASVFGGGGHPRAAGCKIQGSLEQVKKLVVDEVTRFIKQ